MDMALTHKQLEIHVYIINIMATDALLLKYQTISIHNDGLVFNT